jgi:hypothetical protein
MTSAGQNYAQGAGSQMYQQGVNTGNALIAGQQARGSSYGQLGSAIGKYLTSGSSGYSPFGGGSGTFGEGEY